MNYFDSHCHLNLEDYSSSEIEQIFKKVIAEKYFLNLVGVDLVTSQRAVEIAKQYFSNSRASLGLHPNHVAQLSFEEIDQQMHQLEQLYLANKDVVIGFGETGLDLYRSNALDKQLYSLSKHLALAKKYDLPLLIHVRQAHEQLLHFFANNPYNKILIHCFSGDIYNIDQYMKLKCFISFSGNITFKNSSHLLQVLEIVDKNTVLCETDSPFLTPVPFRGQKNYPYYVKYVYLKIAEIWNLDLESTIKIITKNAFTFFNLSI